MDKNEFLKVLELIKPGLSKNPILEQSEMVMFEPDRVFSYNDEIAISCPFETGLSGAIRSIELLKLLKKLKGDELETKKVDDEFQFTCGDTSAGFKMIEDMMPPSLGIDEIKKWNKLPSDFAEALSFCAFSASTNIGMGTLTCLKVEGKEVHSCDNFRATRYRMKTGLAKGLVILVPQSIVSGLAAHNPKKVAITGNWNHFTNDENIVFSSRIMDGEYRDISSIFSDDGIAVTLPEGVKDALSRAEVLTDSTQPITERLVEITIDKNKIICRGDGPAGWVKAQVKTKYDGEKIMFYNNALFLSQIIDHASEVLIGEKVLTFKGDNFDHVVVKMEKA